MEPKRTLGQEMRVVPETREDTRPVSEKEMRVVPETREDNRPVSEKGKKDIYS